MAWVRHGIEASSGNNEACNNGKFLATCNACIPDYQAIGQASLYLEYELDGDVCQGSAHQNTKLASQLGLARE